MACLVRAFGKFGIRLIAPRYGPVGVFTPSQDRSVVDNVSQHFHFFFKGTITKRVACRRIAFASRSGKGNARQPAAHHFDRAQHGGVQQLAGDGQLDAAPLAAEQRLADLRLELADLVADRRRRHAQLVGRARVVAQSRGGLEAEQQFQRGQSRVRRHVRKIERSGQ
ncbi:hypothetical protein GALL_351920 [mine drainage metagenome]|uniref:Uncharacterized protein n=1 Tax=mine drainage metagenome TaxID=410659 RepID=A0A1J5QT13_9ZZZZ